MTTPSHAMFAHLKSALLFALCVAATAPLSATSSDAGEAAQDGSVTAESRYGHGSISGRTQVTPLGAQVQLPGGRWVYCRRSCGETLRVETVDFFESNASPGSGGLHAECGIFGCLDVPGPSLQEQR